jgi:NAD(P)-dependent dehydrogenase (short-subunit alcohol dehydrogenase family)
MSDKKVVLITGASTGFGRLFAETLARKGHTVFASMRNVAGKNAKNAAEIKALAEREKLAIHIVELDVTDEASVNAAVETVVKQAGRIDVAVNNAGYPIIGLVESATTEQARAIFDTNFLGCVRLDRAVLPHMRKQQSGVLVHISSGVGRLVFPTFGLYGATKFAMEALSEAYSYELAGQGIESVLIEPGAYQTAIFGNVVNASDPEREKTYGPMAKVGEKLGQGLAAQAGNAQEVADVLLHVVETPAGERKRRYRVAPAGTLNPLDQINDFCEQIQQGLLGQFGLAEDVKFRKGKGAAA